MQTYQYPRSCIPPILSDMSRNIGNLFYVECSLWLLCSLPVIAVPKLQFVFVAAAFLRLATLGAEGAVAIFFAGQCLVGVLEIRLGTNLPSLMITSLSCSTLLIITRMRACPLGAFFFVSMLPLLALAYVYNGGLSSVLFQRFTMMVSQSLACSLVVASVWQYRVNVPRLLKGFLICTVACAILYFQATAVMFTRAEITSILDIGRIGALTFLVVVIVSVMSNSKRDKVLLMLLGVFPLFVGALTLTRQGVFAAGLAFVVLAGKYKSLRRAVRQSTGSYLVLLIVVAIAVSTCLAALSWLPDIFRLERFTSIQSGRIGEFQRATAMFLESPIIGHGFGAFGVRSHCAWYYPHNLVLEVLCEFGLVGILFGLLPTIFCFAFGVYPRIGQPSEEKVVLMGIFLFWILVSMCSYTLPHSIVCFLFLPWILRCSQDESHVFQGHYAPLEVRQVL